MDPTTAPRKRGRPRDEAALVAALSRGTLDLATKQGEPLTVDAIVAASSTSKPRVYRYFPSAEATLARVYREILASRTKSAVAALATPGTPAERLDALQQYYRSTEPELRAIARIFLHALHQALRDADLATALDLIGEELQAALVAVYAAASSTSPEADGRTLYHLVTGAYLAIGVHRAEPSAVGDAVAAAIAELGARNKG